MTKTFLPILKVQAISGTHQYSQIVNMVSVAGMVSGGGLGAITYETSKHALEAFTNSLRLEMKMFGIRVVALNPSFHDTAMTNNVKEHFYKQVMTKILPEIKEEYGEGTDIAAMCKMYSRALSQTEFLHCLRILEFIETYAKHCDAMVTAGRWNLQVVVDAVVSVVKSKRPPAQLMIGMDRYAHATFNMLPQWARHFVIQLGMPKQVPAVLAQKNGMP